MSGGSDGARGTAAAQSKKGRPGSQVTTAGTCSVARSDVPSPRWAGAEPAPPKRLGGARGRKATPYEYPARSPEKEAPLHRED